MANERSLTDPSQYPTLEEREDIYFTNLKAKYITGIVTSDATYSVGTIGATNLSSVTYSGKGANPNNGCPGKLACDRTWKIKDDEGDEWFIPLFKHG